MEQVFTYSFPGNALGAVKREFVEVYGSSSQRYLTVSVFHQNGMTTTVNDRETELHRLYSNITAVNKDIAASISTGLIVKADTKKFTHLMAGDWESAGYAGPSEAVQGLLCILAETTECDSEAMDAEFCKSGLYADHGPEHANWVEKWERLGSKEILKAIDYFKDKTSLTLGEFMRPAVKGTPFDFIFAPLDGELDGWFPRGDISIVGGSSGSAKSTKTFDMLRRQRDGETVHGHKTYGLSFIVCMIDRGEFANIRTLTRMKIDPNTFPLRPINATGLKSMIRELKEAIEAETVLPAVVFLEGADMILDDAGKMNLVAPLMDELRRLARHYHLAIVLSVGAPKMKVKDRYTLQRDTLFGSVAWGRKCETVITLQFPDGDDTSIHRRMSVQLRNAPSESFDLIFKNGLLEEVPKTIPSVQKTDLNTWVFSQTGWFAVQEAMAGADMSRNPVTTRLNALAASDLLESKKADGKNKNVYRVRKKVTVEVGGQQ